MEDVGENLINTMRTRNEREPAIARSLVETFKKPGASDEIVVSTMYVVSKNNLESCEDQLNCLKVMGKALIDCEFSSKFLTLYLTSEKKLCDVVVWWGRQSHATYDLLQLAHTSQSPQ